MDDLDAQLRPPLDGSADGPGREAAGWASIEDLVTAVSRRLVGVPVDALDAGIEAALGEMGRHVGSDRAYVFAFTADLSRASNTHEWCAPGIEPMRHLLQDVPMAGFDWWLEHFEREHVLVIPDVDAMPDEAAAERQVLAEQSIRSLLAVPVSAEGRFIGLIGFDAVRRRRDWPPEAGALLARSADLLGVTLERQRAGAALRASEARYRHLVDTIREAVFQVDGSGRITFVNPGWSRLTGLSREESLGRPIRELIETSDGGDPLRPATDDGPSTVLHRAGVRVRTADGRFRWCDLDVHGAMPDDGDDSTFGTLREITDDDRLREVAERTRAEQALVATEARFRSLVRNASDIIVLLDDDGVIRYASPATAGLLGYPEEIALGRSVFDVVHPDDRPLAERAFLAAKATPGAARPQTLRLAHADGTWPTFEVVPNNLLDDPAVGGIVVNGRDVTERTLAERTLSGQARILAMIADGRDLPETLHELALTIEGLMDGAMCSVLLLDGDGVTLRHGAAPSLPDAYLDAIDTITAGPQAGSCGTAVHRRQAVIVEDIATDPLWDLPRPLALANGLAACWSVPIVAATDERVLGTFAIYHTAPFTPTAADLALVERFVHLASVAITRRRSDEALEHQALHDSLTDLPNRTLLLDRLEHALARSSRREGEIAVLFCDLDQFKVVNDALGHAVGDALLIAVATRLRQSLRPEDTVSRFGGDEFVIVSEDVTGSEGAQRLAARVHAALRVPFHVAGQELYVSCSIGVSFGGAGDDPTALIRDADAAMYRAKAAGRSRVEILDPDTHPRALARIGLDTDLHRALERNDLCLHYQPLVDLRTGQLRGLEALLRWEHPERGLLPPGEFIPIAEENGLIIPIGSWVIEEASRRATAWQPAHPGLVVTVNLSARQLGAELVPVVAGALRAAGADPATLHLELTESLLMGDTPEVLEVLDAMRDLGVGLSVDDFGTGFASLFYLRHLPVDTVKIDKVFVDGVGADAQDDAIVASVIDLGHALELVVVAEGVETAAQHRLLRAMGCDVGQGYHFARPMPAADVDALLASGPAW